MKYFQYWIEDKHSIRIDGQLKEIKLLVGSNSSIDDAKHEALLRAKEIEARISKRRPKGEYEAGVREFVSEILDASNIVTVCRYGASILNTDQYTVLDLDDYAKSIWDVFKPLKGLSKKERIIFKFEEFLSKNPEIGSDFRIYETANGIRVIGKKYLDPTDRKYSRLMSKLNVDWLYLILSRKQQCYRARLTPKPYRLGIKTIKVHTPLVCKTQAYKNWSIMYDDAALNYTVAKYVKSIGRDFSFEKAVRFHDLQCKSSEELKLA
ncbi:hypothetical protein SAMN02745866_02986 [Alteromonadaceae bacterium Bs31]|nr:hypothetical protein SAMN02745866_02986 [Alteromonadaceae bacterium Bs31]